MTIEKISQEESNRVIELKEKFPLLVYEARGYDTPDKTEWTQENHDAFKEIEDLLKEHIVGFSSFQNLTYGGKGEEELRFRFQYNYGAEDNTRSFIGVGYIKLRELTNGFDVKEKV